jgi:hypothetical protein
MNGWKVYPAGSGPSLDSKQANDTISSSSSSSSSSSLIQGHIIDMAGAAFAVAHAPPINRS